MSTPFKCLFCRYRQGANAAEDRPAHVRAGSSVNRFANKLAVVQDDANFVALISNAGEVEQSYKSGFCCTSVK